jgi:Asp-tRNA(Asn)/Glu-tRNA(Gln) amidotransferase A subunit family amidase
VVPAGFDAAGLPVGLQVVGPAGGDALVLDVAEALGAATPAVQARRPPPRESPDARS